MKRPAYFLPAAAVLIAIGVLAYWLIHRNAQVRWARQVALPQVEKFIQANNFTAAYKLTNQAAKLIDKDPQISEFLGQLTGSLSVTTDPPGAQVFLKDYVAPDSAFELVGLTPLDKAEVPIGYKHWKISKEAFEVIGGAGLIESASTQHPGANPPIEAKLDPEGSIPPGMVRVRADSELAPALNGIGKVPALKLGDFFMDRFEVTNRQYKAFVSDGGYRQPEFWKHKFIRDGNEIPWEEAMKVFVDQTDRPGPATWEFGEYSEGQDDYPVGGVSWYEAAAFAEYAGKALPTVYHWKWAAGDHEAQGMLDSGYIIPLSNFGQKGPVPVGQMRGISPAGIYDLAGNVKEWCTNETVDGQRANVGGAWDEPNYMFANLDRYPPWFRYPDFGLRCIKYLTPSSVDAEAAKPIPSETLPPLAEMKPCSDEMFQAYMKVYEYAKSPLNPKVEEKEDWTRFTVFEKVTFDPAYVGDRTGAYLMIPKEGKRPFQVVIQWPGSGAQIVKSIFEYTTKDGPDILTKTGRAVVIPLIMGTFDRKWTPEIKSKTTGQERRAMMVRDFMRTVDYLETRPEFDTKKLAFEGLSWGAGMGAIIPAIEKRIKALVLIGADLYLGLPPDYSPFNLAPRITAPVLIQNGKYDFATSLEQRVHPLLRLFGTPDKDKVLKLYDAGHAVWLRMEQRRDEIDFLDRVFGPAK